LFANDIFDPNFRHRESSLARVMRLIQVINRLKEKNQANWHKVRISSHLLIRRRRCFGNERSNFPKLKLKYAREITKKKGPSVMTTFGPFLSESEFPEFENFQNKIKVKTLNYKDYM